MADTLKDWLGTFWRILVSPTPRTFVEEAEKGRGKFGSVILWIILFAVCAYGVGIAAGNNYPFATLILLAIVFPFTILLFSSATHFMLQRVFHRQQYLYDKYLYIYTAILLLFQFIALPLAFFLPVKLANILNFIIALYQFVLIIIAIQSIAKIKYWQAAITVLVSVFTGMITLICAIPVLYSFMGSVSKTLR